MKPRIRQTIFLLALCVCLVVSGCSCTKPSARNFGLAQTCQNQVNSREVELLLSGRHSELSSCDWHGYIWPDHELRQPPLPYVPQEGDIVVMTSRSFMFTACYSLGWVGHPLHMGLIIRRYDGSLAIIEAGVVKDKTVSLIPVPTRFCDYMEKSKDPLIWVRPIKQALTPDQSEALTRFAENQFGKKFGMHRLAMFVLPGKPKYTTKPDQSNWYCSELAVEALKQAGICDVQFPSAILPEDVYHNRDIDLTYNWLPALTWTPKTERPEKRPLLAPLRPE